MTSYTEQEARSKWDAHIRAWLKAYCPCRDGVHVLDPNDEEFGGRTVQNFPGADLTAFQELSSAGEGDDFDLLCDFMEHGDIIENVTIRRQDLALIERRLAGKP